MNSHLVLFFTQGVSLRTWDEIGASGRKVALYRRLHEDAALLERCRRQALDDVRQYDWPLIAERYYRQLYQPFLG